MHAAQAGEKALAEPLPARAGADQGLGMQRRRIQRAVPGHRLEQHIAQQRFQLAAGKRPAMAEGRPVYLGPQAGAVGRDQQQLAFRRQHPPKLAQQRAQAFGALQPMHHQNPVEKCVGKGQRVFFHQGGEAFAARPGGDAIMGRHRGHAALGFQQKGPQIGHGIAITQQPQAFDIGPDLAQPAQQDAPGHRAQMAVIEFGKLADIELHAIGVAPTAFTFNAWPASLPATELP